MDSMYAALVLLPMQFVVLMAVLARPSDRRRIAAIERSLSLIVNHLGIVEAEPAVVSAHLDKGNRMRAARAYMRHTGVDMRTAVATVDRMIAVRQSGPPGIPGRPDRIATDGSS
jgi:hypothetical protein